MNRQDTYTSFINGLEINEDEIIHPIRYFYRKYFLYLKILCFVMPKFLKRRWWKKRLSELSSLIRSQDIKRGDCIKLLIRKNTQYSSRPLVIMGTYGIAIRSMSKILRVENMEEITCADPVESTEDNLMDLFNYAILALLLLDDKLI